MIKLKEILYEEIKYREEMRDYHSGQSYMTAYAEENREVVGWCNYSIYKNKVYIDMVEVKPEYRRKGIASELMNFIKQENKNMIIVPGMATDEGDKFWKAYKKK
jgi:GNAT superfamily N-acetyltransferase